MQDNVKTPSVRVALLSAALTLIIMLVPFLITLNERPVIQLPDADFENGSALTEKNGVKYVGRGLLVADYTATVKRGEKASVIAFAENGTEIAIYAYYKSGKSESSVFSPIVAEYGAVSWEWTVPKSSSSDKIRIVLRTADSYATFDITVI